ncbi:hypothetical protein PPYR_06770 [Photinus pyralis]|uniref:Putative nuclease HARBI1 n=2 Tax=Photinus pyralis TaxID=7054 RepID=A0A5N4ANI1_PHOPY|nr:hypothetical protein PPYR_06770 [Photinus pyralis]
MEFATIINPSGIIFTIFMLDISLSSFSSSSDEEEAPARRIRFIRDRNNPFQIYDDIDFKMRYRFSKPIVQNLLHMFGHLIEPKTKRNKSIDGLTQLLITLRFYATGTYQRVIGDHINVNQSTACRVINRVTRHLARQRPNFINMPKNQDDILQVCRGFYRIRGFPKVIGAIDCTHIKIQSPGGNNAELYRNRKGFFSINVQAICDATLKIRHIISRWPGSVHDSTIFNDSPLIPEFEADQYGAGTYLLGDSGYACKKYLLTPFLNPRTPAEERYNRSHVATRNTIERTFGVLKRRFPCLFLGLRNTVHVCLMIIVACAVLHNIAIDSNDHLNEFFENQGRAEDIPIAEGYRNENTSIRTALVNTTFS